MRPIAIAMVVAGCAGEPVPAPPANRAEPPVGAVELVVSLHDVLARDKLGVDDIAAAVGPIVERGSSIALRSTHSELADARVVLLASKAIYLLELRLAAPVSLRELRRVFGEGHRALGLHGERDVMFYPPAGGGTWSVAVIASMSRCHDPHSDAEPTGPCLPITDDSRVERVTFRRDAPVP